MVDTIKCKRTTGGLEEILEGYGLTLRDQEYDLPRALAVGLIESRRWERAENVGPKRGNARGAE